MILTGKQKVRQRIRTGRGKKALEGNGAFQKEHELNRTGFKSCLFPSGNSRKLLNYADPQVPHV